MRHVFSQSGLRFRHMCDKMHARSNYATHTTYTLHKDGWIYFKCTHDPARIRTQPWHRYLYEYTVTTQAGNASHGYCFFYDSHVGICCALHSTAVFIFPNVTSVGGKVPRISASHSSSHTTNKNAHLPPQDCAGCIGYYAGGCGCVDAIVAEAEAGADDEEDIFDARVHAVRWRHTSHLIHVNRRGIKIWATTPHVT